MRDREPQTSATKKKKKTMTNMLLDLCTKFTSPKKTITQDKNAPDLTAPGRDSAAFNRLVPEAPSPRTWNLPEESTDPKMKPWQQLR